MNSRFKRLFLVGTAAMLGGGLSAGLVPSKAAPGIADIQGAYEREAATTQSSHSRGLAIRSAECSAGQDGSYLCWVQYSDAEKAETAIQFDVVVLSRVSTGWRLDSGLCKQ